MSCFKIVKKDSSCSARTGQLKTAHGFIKTPFFMPVATKGAIKNISHEQALSLDFECIISNAFINYLKPGLSIIHEAKGLHNFISWDKAIFTDSGGFQLILEHFKPKISEKGVEMTNPFNKSRELISPEKAIQIQNSLGSDVAMCLDHQPVFGKTRKDYLEATIRTIEWAERCKEAHKNEKQLLFGIVQGGNHVDLRKKCALALQEIGFDGIALGGFGIGEAQKDMYKVIEKVKKVLPENNPTYIMGIGSPIEILNCIFFGADCFDSAFPTRMARHGKIFTLQGDLQINKSIHKKAFAPLDKGCNCFVCKNYSRAYLHHLYKTYEQNAHILLSYHNIYFIQNLIKNSRNAIEKNKFVNFKKSFEKKFSGDKK